MELSEILLSSCRQKILKTLAHERKIRIMKLVRSINCAYNEAKRNLEILEHEDIVIYTRIGHALTISLNFDNDKSTLLLKALRILDTSTGKTQG